LPKGNLDDRTVNDCLIAMQDEYSKHWADNTKPYKGVGELLSVLDELGLSKAVLSNKPDYFTKVMVAKLLPQWSFDVVCGAGPSIPKKPDPTAALHIAEELKIPPRQILYLGDTNTDMQTANSAGMYAVGALWGFRSAEELRKNGAKALVAHPMDVPALLEV
jgi:phosphoglycolate phosphatase